MITRLERTFQIASDTPIIHWILDGYVETDVALARAIMAELRLAWNAARKLSFISVATCCQFRHMKNLFLIDWQIYCATKTGWPWHYPVILQEALGELVGVKPPFNQMQ